MAERLVAWLYDTPVAVLLPAPEFLVHLEWRAEGIERWGLGSPVLSVGLPIGTPTGPRDTRGLDFFENILPEGSALTRIAALAGVRPVDTYGILKAFGRDCAGAIMVLPDGERPGGNGGSGYSPMTPGDLRRVISTLDIAPLGCRTGAGLPPVAGRLPAQGTAWPRRRRDLATSLRGLEMSNDLPDAFSSSTQLLPDESPVDRTNKPRMTWPLRSIPITGISSLPRASPPAHPATVLNPSRIQPPGTLPLAIPGRDSGIGARLLPFHAEAA